jgi:hypothetical protein
MVLAAGIACGLAILAYRRNPSVGPWGAQVAKTRLSYMEDSVQAGDEEASMQHLKSMHQLRHAKSGKDFSTSKRSIIV